MSEKSLNERISPPLRPKPKRVVTPEAEAAHREPDSGERLRVCLPHDHIDAGPAPIASRDDEVAGVERMLDDAIHALSGGNLPNGLVAVHVARERLARLAAPSAPSSGDLDALLETLAAIEHDQWIEWSRTVAAQGLTPERLARWETYWKPYAELDEATKEHDRKWARIVLAARLASQQESGK